MQELEGKAVPQMDLAMKPKANIISYDDIVTSNYVLIKMTFRLIR
jgi:hypothetical protein